MRFWVALACIAALGCGGSVHQESPAGAGGASDPIGIGNTAGGTGQHDGGIIVLTPEQLTQLMNSSCAGWSTSGPEPIDAAIELVLGADVSMSTPPPGSRLSRWDVTKGVVLTTLDLWPQYSDIGVMVHPNLGVDGATPSLEPQDIQACLNVDAIVHPAQLGPPTSQQRLQIQGSLSRVTLGPGRPLSDAYELALAELASSSRVPFVVLFVDGPPTLSQECTNPTGSLSPVDASALVAQIEEASAVGHVTTFVIGLPGSETMRDTLSLAAMAGGRCLTPDICHWDLSSTQDLASSLASAVAEIASDIALATSPPLASCSISIPVPPPGMTLDLTQMSVLLHSGDGNTRLLLQDSIGDCSEGWRFVSAGEIELCPDSCERVQAGDRVEVYFTCQY